jgi:uncharacterized protein (TIGR00730 family)
MTKRVCIFCGSADGARPIYTEAAAALGRGIAEREWTLVFGGSRMGLMGAVANAALEAGGQVIGVIPQSLVDREIAHTGLTKLHVVKTMHERKAMMADLSDAIVALPGGFGTLDEFAEIVTWAQLGYHRKAVCLLNIDGYYEPFMAFVNHMAREGFIRPHHTSIIVIENTVPAMLNTLMTYEPPLIDKWLEKKDL